jgi:hypothetical protein
MLRFGIRKNYEFHHGNVGVDAEFCLTSFSTVRTWSGVHHYDVSGIPENWKVLQERLGLGAFACLDHFGPFENSQKLKVPGRVGAPSTNHRPRTHLLSPPVQITCAGINDDNWDTHAPESSSISAQG